MSPLDGRTYERNSSDAEAQIGPDFGPPVARQQPSKAFKKSLRMGGSHETGL
jgi:hypothetical protein